MGVGPNGKKANEGGMELMKSKVQIRNNGGTGKKSGWGKVRLPSVIDPNRKKKRVGC